MQVVFEHVVWTCVLALGACGLCRVTRMRPNLRHVVWTIVLIKLMCPPFVVSPWSMQALGSKVGLRQLRQSLSARASGTSVAADQADRARSANPGAEASSPIVVQPFGRFWLTVVETRWLGKGICMAWILGSLIVARNYARQMWLLADLSRTSLLPSRGLRDDVSHVSDCFGMKAPQICVVEGLGGPFVVWLGKTMLMCPSTWNSADPTQDRQARLAMLSHELAHIRRRDHWIGWLESLAQVIWWWLPTTWLIVCQLHRTAELSCDEWALTFFPQARRSYATALVLTSRQSSGGVAALALTSGLAGQAQRFLCQRLLRLRQPPYATRLSWWVRMTAVGILLVLIPHWSIADPVHAPMVTSPATGPSPQTAAGAESVMEDPTYCRIRTHMDFLLRDGGHWIAENEKHQSGDQLPQRFHYRFDWGLNRKFAKVAILAEFQGRRIETLAEVTIFCEPNTDTMAFHQYDSDGSTSIGTSQLLPNGDEELQFTRRELDGAQSTYRHLNIRQGANRFINDCFQQLPDGSWKHQCRRTWTRMPRLLQDPIQD